MPTYEPNETISYSYTQSRMNNLCLVGISVATNNDFWTNTNTEYYSFCSFGRIRIPNIFGTSRTIRILFVGNYSNIWGQLFEYLRANNGEKVRKSNVRLFIYQWIHNPHQYQSGQGKFWQTKLSNVILWKKIQDFWANFHTNTIKKSL